MVAPRSFLGWVIFLIQKYYPLFLQGCGVTIVIAVVGTFLGCVIGLLVGVLRTIPKPRADANLLAKIFHSVLQFLLLAYIEIFRGTPMMVQAMVVYYGSAQVFNLNMSPMTAGFFVVSINTGAYMAETVRGGIKSIDKGQTEAAMAIGMSHWQTMVSVVMPQTIRNILPQIGNNLIINIKDTSVLNVISVTELYFNGKSVAGIYYRYFETYFIISIMYFIMTFLCAKFLRWTEHKIDGSGFYELVDPEADPTGMLAEKTPHKPAKGVMRIWLR
jgi:putative lysine transport system permease protein